MRVVALRIHLILIVYSVYLRVSDSIQYSSDEYSENEDEAAGMYIRTYI